MTTRELKIGQQINTVDDCGTVDAIRGDQVTVRWESGITTTQAASVLLAAMEDEDEGYLPCWHCEGEGEIDGEPCEYCDGTGDAQDE